MNQSGGQLIVECESLSLIGLQPSTKARVNSIQMTSGERYTHTFGSGWYNDGLGLNAGTFRCAASEYNSPLRHPAFFLDFSADWGEDVELIISREAMRKK